MAHSWQKTVLVEGKFVSKRNKKGNLIEVVEGEVGWFPKCSICGCQIVPDRGKGINYYRVNSSSPWKEEMPQCKEEVK